MSEVEKRPSIREENGYAVIHIPVEEVHGLRVALAPCPCRAPKSTATESIRQRLAKALGRIGSGVRS